MGKINGENLDFKRKLNIVSGIIANAKKDLESLKTEIDDVKSDHAISKKNLNLFNNEFIEYLKESLKVNDSLIKIDISLYDTLAEDLKKCNDTILKNSSNICVKQDTKKNDTDNVNVCEKQDTKKNEASINENDDDNDSEADDDDDNDDDYDNDSEADDDSEADGDSVNKDFPNLSDKTINNLIIIDKIRK